jgi:hypothetical protein
MSARMSATNVARRFSSAAHFIAEYLASPLLQSISFQVAIDFLSRDGGLTKCNFVPESSIGTPDQAFSPISNKYVSDGNKLPLYLDCNSDWQ